MLNKYGILVKKKLIDLGESQKWLIDQVKERTGLYCDSAYMSRVIGGKCAPPNIVSAINEVLGIRQ